MSLNAGEVEVLLKLRDDLSSQLVAVREKLKDVGGALSDAGKNTSVFSGEFARMTASFSVANIINKAVDGIIGFGKEAYQAATRIADLSSKTGLSTDMIQKMAFVAESTGSSMEVFTQSAFKLSANLAGGNASVVGAVERLGLSFEKLRSLSPEDQFSVIMQSLGKMTNEGERAQLGMELFGKGFAGMAASVSEGYDRLANKATLMSEETIRAADAFDDRWIESKTFMKALLAETASFVWDIRLPFVALGEAVGLFAKEVVKARGDIGLSAPVYTDWAQRMGAAHDVVDKLTAGQLKQIASAQTLGATTEELIIDFKLTEDAVKLLSGKFGELSEAEKKATKSVEEHTKALKKLDEEYTKLMSDVKNANQLAIMEADAHRRATDELNKKTEAARGWIAQQVAITKGKTDETAATAALFAEEEKLFQESQKLIGATATIGTAAVEAANQGAQGFAGFAQQVTLTGDAIIALLHQAQYMASVNAILGENSLFTSIGQYERIAKIKVPSFDVGGPVMHDGLIGAHAGEYVVPKGGALVTGQGNSRSVIVNNTFNIVDTEANIARRVSERILRTVMSGTQLAGS